MSAATTDPVPLDQPSPRATLPQAVRRFFLNYAVFTGRASRAEYWWTVLFFFLVYATLWVVVLVLVAALIPAGGTAQAVAGYSVLGLGLLIGLTCIVPSIAISVRRLHDANLSGFLYLLHLVPYLGSLIVLILMLLPSNPLGVRFDESASGYAPYPRPGDPGAAEAPPPSAAPLAEPPADDVPPTPPTPPTPPARDT